MLIRPTHQQCTTTSHIFIQECTQHNCKTREGSFSHLSVSVSVDCCSVQCAPASPYSHLLLPTSQYNTTASRLQAATTQLITIPTLACHFLELISRLDWGTLTAHSQLTAVLLTTDWLPSLHIFPHTRLDQQRSKVMQTTRQTPDC